MAVKVAKHPDTGAIITPSVNNPDYGTIRVDSVHTSMENGFLNIQKRSAFIRGSIANLEACNFTEGKALPGLIQRRESFEPFYEGQVAKINPTTQEPVLKDGREVFMEHVYTSNPKAPDYVWVETELVENPVGEDTQGM